MFRKAFIISFAICILFLQNYAQTQSNNSFLLDSKKPSIFITFDHRDKLPPLEDDDLPPLEGENINRIFLRLHNNTKIMIFICGFTVEKQYGEVGLAYDIKATTSSKIKKEDIPLGYGIMDFCDIHEILPGKSILFSLPSEHLASGLYIQTEFKYSWTGDWQKEISDGTFHYVNFSL